MRAVERQLEEIKRLEEASEKSKSRYLKKDYSKRIARLKKELKEYCFYRGLKYFEIVKEIECQTSSQSSRNFHRSMM